MNILAQRKNIRMETTNHYEDIHILADPLRMRELLLNLIENGIKYTEEGGSVRIALLKESQSSASEIGDCKRKSSSRLSSRIQELALLKRIRKKYSIDFSGRIRLDPGNTEGVVLA